MKTKQVFYLAISKFDKQIQIIAARLWRRCCLKFEYPAAYYKWIAKSYGSSSSSGQPRHFLAYQYFYLQKIHWSVLFFDVNFNLVVKLN